MPEQHEHNIKENTLGIILRYMVIMIIGFILIGFILFGIAIFLIEGKK